MNLQPGTRLRQYEILEAIGAGGMGEVYRARDTNLERDVAVKVLPRSLADNPLNLARLEREARAIASLSHPNILAVYDFGSEDDTAFLVTELLEGETLRERLAHGAMPARKATDIGRQIARGLAAAHDKSIVHRDLKPENIYLNAEGRVKILDFGLATAGVEDDGADVQDLATMTNLTAPGSVLGTVNYMSPEQVKGQATDNRSDLFSFGSVLYEMLAGKRPFHQETHAETMTAILKEEPADLTTIAPETPPALAAIIRRCLEKQAGERFHSAHDLAFSLEALSGSAVSTGTAAALAGMSVARRRPSGALAAGLVALGLVIGAVAAYLLKPTPAPPDAPDFELLSSRRGTVTGARFTGNDGAAVYSATWEGGPVRVYPATPGTRTSEPLNLESADLLSVSPSGELAVSLDRRYPAGFEAVGTLAVAQPGGAAPRRLLENVFVADWAPDGQTLAVAHEVDGVVRLEYPIGTVLYESAGWISSLRVNPDGERILFADCPARGDNTAVITTVNRRGEVRALSPGGSWGVVWAPDGETILSSYGPHLYADEPSGERRRLRSMIGALNLLDVDAEGRMLVATGLIRREMMVLAPGANTETNLGWLDWPTPHDISADGRHVLFEEGNEFNADGYAVYLRQSDGTPPLLLGYGSTVALSPDQKHVALIQRYFQADAALVIIPTGPGENRTLDLGDLQLVLADGLWLAGGGPDDRGALVISCRQGDEPARLYYVPVAGGAAPRAITPADMALSTHGHIASPDGARIIVKPANGPAVEFGVDGSGPRPVPGVLPEDVPLQFGADGREIFVQGEGNNPALIYRIDLETGARTLWKELSPLDGAGVQRVDRIRLSRNGTSHVYSIRRSISHLGIIDPFE